MVPLSVVIITYNEANNIGRCLKSVKDIADEIVVVDSYSTDRTEEICHEHDARFIKHAFEGHIQQKNYAITQARHPHILSLDADEVLSDQLRNSIRRTLGNWKHDGYYCNRLTNYCGKWIRHSGWYPDRKLRLWDARKGSWGGKNPHDRFMLEAGCTTGRLKGDLLHYSFYSIRQHMDTVNKFSEAAARSLYEQGKKSNTLKILVKSTAKFIRNYFIKAGFLDGYYGFLICRISSFSTMLRYAKLKEMRRNSNANSNA